VSNRLVELVQHYLDDLGYAPGPLDGLIGPRTLDAVRRFQRDQGLAATGVLSFELLERLQTARGRGQTREVPITGARPGAEGGRP
jgi:peptidoglycan hydrolase-like protein with peptidoglycan-binding domain